jgi:predicted metal-dependent hydrolase
MPTVQIGRTKIEYELRRSETLIERRITVTPGHVEVVALANDDDTEVAKFVSRKREWLFNAVRQMEQVSARRHALPRFATGSKIPYCGRRRSLTVRRTDADRAQITYRNGFTVDLPHWVGRDADRLVASELGHWLRQDCRRRVTDIAALYCKRFGLSPKSVRVTDLASGWGSCGPEGNVLIHWHLIFAPAKVLEYVVVHELAHLRERSHGPRFWSVLAAMLPDNAAPRAWLEQHQGELSDGFLGLN